MPGFEERTPSEADRPPVSRVGDELQKEAAASGPQPTDERAAEAEEAAHESAREMGWDQKATAREGGGDADG